MEYENLTTEQLSALHIADVNESFLTFENEYAIMEIFKSDTTTGFEIKGDEGFYLTIEQRKFMAEWLLS